MEMILWLQYCISGVLLCALCAIGLLGNTLTLYILNVNREMRKQSINIYLTVLALYDNGVLLNAILMLGVPALYIRTSYHDFSDSNTSSSPMPSIPSLPLSNSQLLNQSFVHQFIDNEKNIIERAVYSISSNFTDDFIDTSNDSSSNIRYLQHYYSPIHFYIRIVYPLALISQTGSIWTTCLITAERYLAICYPLRSLTLSTRTRAIWALVTLSIAAFIYNLPRFAEIEMSDDNVKQSELRKNKLYYWLYYICLNLTLVYVIPLSLLSVLNTKIYLTVRSASSNRGALTRHEERELNLASMLVLLVAIFLACNAPAFVVHCLELINPPYLGLATMFSNLLVCLNSSVNFLIYCIFGKKFRHKLKEVFKCKWKPNRRKSTNRHQYYFGASFVADTFV